MQVYDIVLQNFLPILVAAIVLFYLYYQRKFQYWKSRGVNYVPPTVFFGNLLDIFLEYTHVIEMKRYSKYGRIYGAYNGTTPFISVGDPELVKLILVKDFHIFPNRRAFSLGHEMLDKMVSVLQGEEWKRVRAIISPSFTSGRMRKMAHLVNQSAEMLVENLLKAAEEKSPVECKIYFGNFTMDTIARCAFGTKINAQTDPNDPFVLNARKLFSSDAAILIFMILMYPGLCSKLGSRMLPRGSFDFFTNVSKRIIQERKATGERGNDFLQLVMDAQEGALQKSEEENEAESHYDLGTDNVSNQPESPRSKGLSVNEGLAQCFLFFLVGYDTTASTLSFASYCLALNPECQEKLIKEVDEVWEKKGAVDFDTVTKMQYLDAVICETLRLHSVVWRTERIAVEDYVLGDTGITIPKGMAVAIPIYAMHRDPEWYPDPTKFDPERFSPENKAARDPYTFLPFGAGPRNCLAMRFALMEAKLCLAHVMRHIRFHKGPGTKVPPEYYKGQGVVQAKSLQLLVEKRRHDRA